MWVLRAAVCLALPILIAAQCDTGDDKTFAKPDKFLIGDNVKAVAVWSEVTSTQIATTYVVREVYDQESNKYFLEFFDGNVFQKLVHDEKNKFLYSYTDDMCTTLTGAQTANFYRNFPLMSLLKLRDVPADGFLGPAAIFERFTASKADAGRFTQCDDFDRVIPCVKYRECAEQQTDYVYSLDGHKIFDQQKSRPLRAVLQGGATIDVLSVKTYTSKVDLFLPTGLSCNALKDETTTVPMITGTRAFVGEVVFNTNLNNNIYVAQLSGIVIPSDDKKAADGRGEGDNPISGFYSFTTNNFKSNEEATDFVPGNRRRTIYDADHFIVYEHSFTQDEHETGLEKSQCTISINKDFEPSLELPFYGGINLRQLFLMAPSSVTDIVNYLGENQIRGIKTKVYEVTYPMYKTTYGIQFSRLVVAFHIKNDDSPAAIEITGYGMESLKNFTATIHISKFDETVTQLNEKVRIDDCYDYVDNSESRWFEVGFEMKNPDQLVQIRESAFEIREAFVEKLRTLYHVEPMRIPQVNVDFNEVQVVINALLLERPLVQEAFRPPLKKDFREATKSLGVMSETACLITCLGMNEQACTAVSYCGATCSYSNKQSPAAPANTVDSTECLVYERGLDHSVDASAIILRSIAGDVTTSVPDKVLKLSFTTKTSDGTDAKPETIEITANTFDATKNFDNVFHFDKDKSAILETSFKISNPRRKLLEGTNAKTIASLELEDCALACKNRGDCESFSYCRNSRDCTISSTHDYNVTAETEEDSQCVVYQTKYVERFDKLPGLTIAGSGVEFNTTNADSCAQRCIAREDCKSFDFCDASGACTLFLTHITENAAVGKANFTQQCNHYSKKFLYDYAIVPGKKGNGDATTVLEEYSNVSPAACAKLCSEWPDATTVCLSFDFCAAADDNTGVCSLRTVGNKETPADSPTCNFYYATVAPTAGTVKHGAGSTFGLSILMILVGVGLGVGGLFAYGKFRGV